MGKIKSIFKMLFNNEELMKSKEISLFIVAIILLINVSLISVPNFVGKVDGVSSISNIEGIEEVFTELYDIELDCSIDENSIMECSNFVDFTINDYLIRYDNIIDLETVDESTVYFSEEYLTIVYVDEDDLAYGISGNFSKLNNFSFSEILTSDYEELTKDEYYEEVTDIFLTNIYFSTLEDDFTLIYLSQFAQIFIYILVLAGMFMLVNLGSDILNLKFKDSIKLVVLSMTGPAFISAILGLFIIAWANILFLLIYGLRLMFVYYMINPRTVVKTKSQQE